MPPVPLPAPVPVADPVTAPRTGPTPSVIQKPLGLDLAGTGGGSCSGGRASDRAAGWGKLSRLGAGVASGVLAQRSRTVLMEARSRVARPPSSVSTTMVFSSLSTSLPKIFSSSGLMVTVTCWPRSLVRTALTAARSMTVRLPSSPSTSTLPSSTRTSLPATRLPSCFSTTTAWPLRWIQPGSAGSAAALLAAVITTTAAARPRTQRALDNDSSSSPRGDSPHISCLRPRRRVRLRLDRGARIRHPRLMNAFFRYDLARRLVHVAALAAPFAAASSTSGCGIPGCGDDTNPVMQLCFDPATVDVAFPLDAGPTTNGCPTSSSGELQEALNASGHGQPFKWIVSAGPTIQGTECCYTAQADNCIGGRPFLVDGHPLVAPGQRGEDGWTSSGDRLPDTRGLSAELCAELADAWTRDGLFEHASVASFARFSLELLATGAPAELVELAHRAALDEVRHARLCLSLAGAYAGAPVGVGPLPLGGSVEVESDLASMAARAAREGCIGETVAAVLAAEQLARATDPVVRRTLEIIAADEARHAELAFRAVAWAMRVGGAPVRAAVAAVLEPLEGDADTGAPRREGPLDHHGRLEAEEQRRVAAQAMAEVVRPAARTLLGAAARLREAVQPVQPLPAA